VQQAFTDRSLADAHEGSEHAFEDLVGPLVEPGYRLACGMLHDSFAAQDAVQEATLTAWRKLRQVKSGEKLRPWFLGIVANECRNVRRLKWTSGVTLGVPEVAQRSQQEALLRGADLRRALGRARS
jgi:DNA-directed RNA polymerase specialized sigma24 family protein